MLILISIMHAEEFSGAELDNGLLEQTATTSMSLVQMSAARQKKRAAGSANKFDWVVFQQRTSNATDFYRDWTSYVNGFGDAANFWGGLSDLHTNTTEGCARRLRVELSDHYGNTCYQEYENFQVGDSSTNYTLQVGANSGTCGDSLTADHNGQQFSTHDADHDSAAGFNCAAANKGAWWYNGCHTSNLNGKYYYTGNITDSADRFTGVIWYAWRGYDYSVNSKMMHACEASATDDPHISNIAGEHFNVLRPGTYTLVEIPRGAKLGQHQLLISARIDQLLGECETGGLFVQSLNVSGRLLNGVGPLTVDAVSKQIDALDVLHVKKVNSSATTTASEFAKSNSGIATFDQAYLNRQKATSDQTDSSDQPDPNRQNLKLEVGGVVLNIAGRRRDIEKPKEMHIDFLDLRMTGLSDYPDVGGLLGNDDHTDAASAPANCAKTELIRIAASSGLGSRLTVD